MSGGKPPLAADSRLVLNGTARMAPVRKGLAGYLLARRVCMQAPNSGMAAKVKVAEGPVVLDSWVCRPHLLWMLRSPPFSLPPQSSSPRHRDIVLLTNSGIFEKLRRYSVRNNAKAPLIASSRLFRQTGRHQSTSPLPVGLHQRPSHCATFSPRPRLPSSGSLLHSFHSRSDLWGISLFPTSNPQPIVCSPFAVRR